MNEVIESDKKAAKESRDLEEKVRHCLVRIKRRALQLNIYARNMSVLVASNAAAT